jgi:hypothetical protein
LSLLPNPTSTPNFLLTAKPLGKVVFMFCIQFLADGVF